MMQTIQNNLEDIISKVSRINPSFSKKEIIDALSEFLIETYYLKLNQKSLHKTIDDFKKKKLLFKQKRATHRDKSDIDKKFKKAQRIDEINDLKDNFLSMINLQSSSDSIVTKNFIPIFELWNSTDISESKLNIVDDNVFIKEKEVYKTTLDKELYDFKLKNATLKEDLTLSLDDKNVLYKIKSKKIRKKEYSSSKNQEPENFYILSNKSEDLILKTKNEINNLLKELDTTEYDEKLKEFFFNYEHEIQDFTDED